MQDNFRFILLNVWSYLDLIAGISHAPIEKEKCNTIFMLDGVTCMSQKAALLTYMECQMI